jgi:hypothetical protein
MGQKIYDPTIASDRLVTTAEVNAAAKGDLSIKGAPGQSVGFQMPPSLPTGGDESGGAQDILNAFPQIAGLLAQFTPLGKTYKGAMAVPAVVDAITRAIRGEDFDPMSAASHAVGGALGKGAGEVISGTGKIGEGLVRRSLNLSGGPYATRAGEEMLPKLALREKAKMTIPGVDAITAKAQATGSGGLDDLADALEQARLKSSLGPVGGGGGIMAVFRDLFSNPRQMAVGSAMAQPYGVNMSETLAPMGEAGVRAFLAYLASQLGDTPAEPPTPSGPRRRSP